MSKIGSLPHRAENVKVVKGYPRLPLYGPWKSHYLQGSEATFGTCLVACEHQHKSLGLMAVAVDWASVESKPH